MKLNSFYVILFICWPSVANASDYTENNNTAAQNDNYEQFGDWFDMPVPWNINDTQTYTVKTSNFSYKETVGDKNYLVSIINNIFMGDGVKTENSKTCPFDTDTECKIWKEKPTVNEAVNTEHPVISTAQINNFISASMNKDSDSLNDAAKPFIDNYKLISKYSAVCCTDGMLHAMKSSGASNNDMYNFLVSDINSHNLTSKCLMTDENYFNENKINNNIKNISFDIKTGCICNNKKLFNSLIKPFEMVYSSNPEFKDTEFNYEYTDSFNHKISTDINSDINEISKQLETCK